MIMRKWHRSDLHTKQSVIRGERKESNRVSFFSSFRPSSLSSPFLSTPSISTPLFPLRFTPTLHLGALTRSEVRSVSLNEICHFSSFPLHSARFFHQSREIRFGREYDDDDGWGATAGTIAGIESEAYLQQNKSFNSPRDSPDKQGALYDEGHGGTQGASSAPKEEKEQNIKTEKSDSVDSILTHDDHLKHHHAAPPPSSPDVEIGHGLPDDPHAHMGHRVPSAAEIEFHTHKPIPENRSSNTSGGVFESRGENIPQGKVVGKVQSSQHEHLRPQTIAATLKAGVGGMAAKDDAGKGRNRAPEEQEQDPIQGDDWQYEGQTTDFDSSDIYDPKRKK